MKTNKYKVSYKIKLPALIIFALIPFISFFIGMKYQAKLDNVTLNTYPAIQTNSCDHQVVCNGPMLPVGCTFNKPTNPCDCPTKYTCVSQNSNK